MLGHTFNLLTFDLPTFDLPTFDLLTFDLLTFDLLRFDLLTFDLLTFDALTSEPFFNHLIDAAKQKAASIKWEKRRPNQVRRPNPFLII